MRLESLTISRPYFGSKERLRAVIKFTNAHGEVSLNLNDADTDRMLAVVADLVIESGKETASLLTREVIEQLPEKRATMIDGNAA